MLNQVVLIGRLESKEEQDDYLKGLLKIRKSKKNKDGVYEFDIIPFYLPYKLIENFKEELTKGTLIAIKAHLLDTKEELQVVVEKITIL